MTRLIGLYSPAPGSGKSTAAQALVADGWTLLPFAAPLKRMAATLLLEAGYSPTDINTILSTRKTERLVRLAGAPTGRHLLQSLGTAWGREQISPQLWIKLWQQQAQVALGNGNRVVVDDLRTEQEAAVIRAMDGGLWRITRPGHHADPAALAHPTEGALDGFAFDHELINDSTIERLQRQIQSIAT